MEIQYPQIIIFTGLSIVNHPALVGTPQVSDEEFRSIVAERRSDWARTPGPPAETTWATWAVENVFSKRHQVVGKDSGYSDGSLAWKSWE